jgi:hypothetical protein
VSARNDYPAIAIHTRHGGSEGQECIDALAEIDRLRQWKIEATEVFKEWDDAIADVPATLGLTKAECVKRELKRLRDQKTRLRTELAKWGWGDMHYGDQPQDAAIVALLEETA